MSINIIYSKFLTTQVNMNQSMMDDIYGEGDLSNHLFEKWMYCDRNIIEFINRLDIGNKTIFLSWINDINDINFILNYSIKLYFVLNGENL